MTAISRKMVKIAIVSAGTVPSTLAPTDYITGEIQNYSQSGGDSDSESVPVFGGFVDKEKPESQVEVALELIPSLEGSAKWDAMTYSVDVKSSALDKPIYTMASGDSTIPGKRAVFIEASSLVGTETLSKSIAYNNCDVTTFEMSHAADDNRTGNITFKLSPTNSNGVSNYMAADLAVTGLPAWTSLDNNSA